MRRPILGIIAALSVVLALVIADPLGWRPSAPARPSLEPAPSGAAVSPAPAATPTPVGPGDRPFLARPASDPIVRTGGSAVEISNIAIDGGSVTDPQGIGITIKNVHGSIVIRDVDLANLIGGIYIDNSSGTLLIENVRSRNMGNGTIGGGKSNHIQLAESSFSGYIRDSWFLGGQTEDMISIWHSGGRGSGEELVVEFNHLQGMIADTDVARAWRSDSGTGIIIGDGGGSPKNGYVIVRGNRLLNAGQVGIQHVDGPGLQTYDNIIYAAPYELNNNPITSWEGSPVGTVRDNRYCWTNLDGSQPKPWLTGYGSMTAENNVSDCTIDPTDLQAWP